MGKNQHRWNNVHLCMTSLSPFEVTEGKGDCGDFMG